MRLSPADTPPRWPHCGPATPSSSESRDPATGTNADRPMNVSGRLLSRASVPSSAAQLSSGRHLCVNRLDQSAVVMRRPRKLYFPVAAGALALAVTALPTSQQAGAASGAATPPAKGASPATPIQHLVVIFQENVSFDHYFGTYPKAANRPGETT